MKNQYTKASLFLSLVLTASVALSQNIAINNSGNAAYASAILDLSNQNNAGSLGFLPPYVKLNTPLTSFQLSGLPAQSNGMIIWANGAGTAPAGLYYWNNTSGTWVSMSGGAGSVTAANDGTSLSGTTVILGGAFNTLTGELTQNTEIPMNGYNISFSSGGAGMGNIGIDVPVNTSAAQALEVGGNTNTVRIDGLKLGSTWYSPTTPVTATSSMVMVNNSTGDLQALAPTATNGQVLTQTAGGPAWQAPGAATVNADNGLTVGSFTSGDVELGGAISAPAPLKGNSVISGSGYNLDFDLGTYTATGSGAFFVTNGGLTNPYLSVTYNAANSPAGMVGVNVNPAVSNLDVNGSIGYATTSVSGTTTLTSAYSTVFASPGSGYTITLPSAATYPRRVINVVYEGSITNYKTSSTSNIVYVTCPTGQSIISGGMAYGPATASYGIGNGSVTLQSDGTNWDVISCSNNQFYSYNSGTVNSAFTETATIANWTSILTLFLPYGNYMVTYSTEGANTAYANFFYCFTDGNNTAYTQSVCYAPYAVANNCWATSPTKNVLISVGTAGLTLYIRGATAGGAGQSEFRNSMIQAIKVN